MEENDDIIQNQQERSSFLSSSRPILLPSADQQKSTDSAECSLFLSARSSSSAGKAASKSNNGDDGLHSKSDANSFLVSSSSRGGKPPQCDSTPDSSGASTCSSGFHHQHQLLQHRYRTFSFDGMMMLRNQSSGSNHQHYHHHRNHSHHSSWPIVPPARTQSPPPSQQDHSTTTSSASTFKKTSYLRSHSAQDPGELVSLLHDQSQSKSSSLVTPRRDESHSTQHQTNKVYHRQRQQQRQQQQDKHNEKKKAEESKGGLLYYFIYALLNTMMSVPSLYGYASVIFNHPAFNDYIATLSKLVIWSSAVHQLTFVLVSSISFAKAEVQDAGLLFLSCISHYIAESILNDQGTTEEIVSTTIVALGIATASLGLVLMLMGKFNCATAVSYLPLPVVGGYLAFIGYFCVVAGAGLCISKSMVDGNFFTDIQMLFDKQSLILALPGLVSGLIMMLISRYAKSDIALPLSMVIIPSIFYVVLFIGGYTLEDARKNLWVGEIAPPASITALFDVFDLNEVRWDLIFSRRVLTVWCGMVFVVSFSSCLDVAAISMDMGEPLNVNKELITVGLSNLISGVLLGQTGSYIFSQTILTYRTGFHSRWIGFIGSMMFLFFVVSKCNLLQIAPLFFLGSTLIFIGIDLLYEWLIEVWHRLLLSEYIVLVATFIAIQIVGIDGGIILGALVAIVEFIVQQSQLPSLRRVLKQSRAVWEPQHRKLLQDFVYDSRNPKIITLEITETVFFGSSMLLFSKICDEINLEPNQTDFEAIILASPGPHTSRSPSTKRIRQHKSTATSKKTVKNRPRFVVLEMTQVANVDASAARSCFLQLAKMCSKNGIILCAAGVNRRVDWILRSHEVSYSDKEEQIVKGLMLNPLENVTSIPPSGKLVSFTSINECLELCENQLIYEFEQNNLIEPPKLGTSSSNPDLNCGQHEEEMMIPLSTIFGRILGMEGISDKLLLQSFDSGGSAEVDTLDLKYAESVFTVDQLADSFFIVLCGSVGICRADPQEEHQRRSIIHSRTPGQSEAPFTNVVSYLSVGGIFGFVDFAIQRRRSFNAVCLRDGTVVAKISRSMLERLSNDDKVLHQIIERVLMQASLMELANIDVS